MLSNLTLENFKAFQKLDNLKIKPITIFCGTNSCGKSSIMQSLLLMKQSLENNNPSQNLLLNGRFAKLGNFEDVIYKKDKNQKISIKLLFPDLTGKALGFSDYGDPSYGYTGMYQDPLQFYYHIHAKTSFFINNDSSEVQELELTLIADNYCGIFEKIDINILHTKEGSYKIQWSGIELDGQRSGEDFMNLGFSNVFNIDLRFEDNLTPKEKAEKRILFKNLPNFFSLAKDCLRAEFEKYLYLGPLRHSHKDSGGFYYGDDVTEIGNSGENAPYLFLKEQHKKLNKHYFFNKAKDDFEWVEQTQLGDALDEWFSLMGVEGFSGTINNRMINLQLKANKFDDTEVDVSQVGFGISQMFPILLEGLRMKQGATLMLEQPEIHLHPDLQMQMADFFIAMALSGKNIMAETHSDHIINRLVRRIVEDDKYNLKDKIAIYFIKPSENGAIYEEIQIDENKGIVNWPPNFFDQAAKEQMRIMQAGLNKRKKQK